MEAIKWVGLAFVALFVWSWLRRGPMSASIQAQAYPPGWGSGMLYAPGMAWSGTPYPMAYPWPMPRQSSWSFGVDIPTGQDGQPLSFGAQSASY